MDDERRKAYVPCIRCKNKRKLETAAFVYVMKNEKRDIPRAKYTRKGYWTAMKDVAGE